MNSSHGFSIREVIRNIGARTVVVSVLAFLLAVAMTFVGGVQLYRATKENIELQDRLNAVESAKEFDAYLLVRKNTVMLAGHVVDEMMKEGDTTPEIIEYLTTESASIKKSIDKDYTGLYGWINNEYCDGVGWVPEEGYVATERPWYTETMADNSDVTFVKPYLDKQTGTVLTTVAKKLADGTGVIALDISLGRIQEITEDIAQDTPGAMGIVLDKTGQVIAHSDVSELGKNYLDEEGTIGAALADSLDGHDKSQFELSFDGQNYVVFTQNIEGGWKAVSLINTASFYRPLQVFVPLMSLVILFEALVFVAIIYGQSERNLAIAAAREAESASRAKSRFLSRMSHEIRTPINAIIGLDAILLHDESVTGRTRESLEKISMSAHHLLSLINDILDMSRIESGRMELAKEVFSLTELLGQVETIIGGQCEDKQLRFVCERAEGLDEHYIGDALKLKQVMINVLGNSVKFTEAPGTVTLAVGQEPASDGRVLLRLTMSDTGIGMDEEFIPKLFETFSQEDTANTTKYGGSGLGMAITKSLVDMMGGEIRVESEKGVGTTFHVDVPLGVAEQDAVAAQAAAAALDAVVASDAAVPSDVAAEPTAASLEGRHMLIAEDQEMNAEVLADLLDLEGMTSEWAEDGQRAVEMFGQSSEGHFDAILMDMRMPVMDGLEATRAIRKLDRPDAASIPIVALTANAFEEDVRQCLEAGMDVHLSKPVDIDALVETLAVLLAERADSISTSTRT